MVATVSDGTATVVTGKVMPDWPSGTVTEVGTLTALVLLAMLTVAPPGPAWPLRTREAVLGLPPDTPSWGQAIASAADGGLYRVTPWLMIFPGIFLILTTLSFNLLGDGLRDAIDPRTDR